MNNIAIYGAGGFGKEVVSLLKNINKIEKKWKIVGFFDDNSDKWGKKHFGFGILGGIDQLNGFGDPISIVFSIGNPIIVKSIVQNINNPNVFFPNIISPDCIFLDKDTTKFGKGNLIMYQSLISVNVEFSDFNVLNCGISIGHDSLIGSYNSFMSYAKISGEVNIGDMNYFGACSLVLQQKKIGCNTTIGASSVIMRDTEDGNTYLGNPAIKILKPKQK